MAMFKVWLLKALTLKIVSATLLVYFLGLQDSPCETWKNVFHINSKVLSTKNFRILDIQIS